MCIHNFKMKHKKILQKNENAQCDQNGNRKLTLPIIDEKKSNININSGKEQIEVNEANTNSEKIIPSLMAKNNSFQNYSLKDLVEQSECDQYNNETECMKNRNALPSCSSNSLLNKLKADRQQNSMTIEEDNKSTKSLNNFTQKPQSKITYLRYCKNGLNKVNNLAANDKFKNKGTKF